MTQELIADMVSYRKNVTGLNNTVFISVKFAQHAPRIKVAIDPPTHIDPFGNSASIAIRDGSERSGSPVRFNLVMNSAPYCSRPAVLGGCRR